MIWTKSYQFKFTQKVNKEHDDNIFKLNSPQIHTIMCETEKWIDFWQCWQLKFLSSSLNFQWQYNTALIVLALIRWQ